MSIVILAHKLVSLEFLVYAFVAERRRVLVHTCLVKVRLVLGDLTQHEAASATLHHLQHGRLHALTIDG